MKRFWPLVLILAGFLCLGIFHGRILGMVAEPFLEKLMSRAFDMPVYIRGLSIEPWPSARVSVEHLEILNPAGFKRRDQFTVKGMECFLDLNVLKNKFIRIRRAHFNEVIFAIESYMTPEGSRNNVWHWYHHMGLDEDDPPLPPRAMPHPDNVGEDSWRVRIDRLELENGTIVFDDRREEPEQQWVFRRIKGVWSGFDFLSDYVSPTFTETIQVQALFGTNPPAAFKGGGRCQFADGDNFDVNVEITGGSMVEYHFLVDGIQGDVQSGTFDLKSHLLCVEGDLRSQHVLTLRDMQFTAPTAAQKLMKYPFSAIRLLLEDQKTVTLEIKVDGDIDDPKFRMIGALTKAIQKSLYQKTKAGIKSTVQIAASAPLQVGQGLSKIGTMLTDPFFSRKTNELQDAGGDSDGSN